MACLYVRIVSVLELANISSEKLDRVATSTKRAYYTVFRYQYLLWWTKRGDDASSLIEPELGRP